MPKMGESIMEGTILKWHKKAGDTVEKDENILDIATDKVDAEVPASESGTIAEILFQEGAEVPVGEVIAIIETDANVSAEELPLNKTATTKDTDSSTTKSNLELSPASDHIPTSESNSPQELSNDEKKSRFYSPVVMNIAQKEGVSITELNAIPGTGVGNRLTKSDLLSYLKNRNSDDNIAPKKNSTGNSTTTAADAPHSTLKPPQQSPMYDPERSDIIQMDNIRKRIAEHMVNSKHTSAHVTSVSEVNVTGLVRLVKSKKESFHKNNGVKLTYTPFFVDACIKTLKQFPNVNISVDGDKIIRKKYINFGIAVALGNSGAEGLIVPVIKDADEMNLVGLSRSIQTLASKARQKKLQPDDIQGGTFTLTNYGTTGNLFGSPIINQPQVAILGTGAIVKRPVVHTLEDGSDSIVIRSMMYLSLSYDHRVIDGALAGSFLQALVKNLETYNENTPL